MATFNTITSANAVFMLAIDSVFPVPQRLEGYSADAAFETESVEPAEVIIGVDGQMSAGYTPFLTPQTVTLMADSPSATMFDAWINAQKVALDIYYASGFISLPSVKRSYVLTQGALTGIVAVPSARRTLQARAFRITWRDVSPAPFTA